MALQHLAPLGAVETLMLVGEEQGIQGVAKQMLAALCLAWLPASLPTDWHQHSLPMAPHEKPQREPPTRHFFLLVSPITMLKPDGPVPSSTSQAALFSLSCCQAREEEEEEELLWGQPGLLRSGAAIQLHLQFQKAPGTVKGPYQI